MNITRQRIRKWERGEAIVPPRTRKELEEIIKRACEHYEVKAPALKFNIGRKRWLARCWLNNYIIEVSTYLINNTDYDNRRIIIHEVAHHILWEKERIHYHGPKFAAVMKEILDLTGIGGHPEQSRVAVTGDVDNMNGMYRWLYACSKCKKGFKRKVRLSRRHRYSCRCGTAFEVKRIG